MRLRVIYTHQVLLRLHKNQSRFPKYGKYSINLVFTDMCDKNAITNRIIKSVYKN